MFKFIVNMLQKKQTPVGSWRCVQEEVAILLQFEGGPHEGIYKQLTQSGGHDSVEYGHWASKFNDLQMIIWGLSDGVKGDARIKVDRKYEIRYVEPQGIKITGPERPNLVFKKTKETLHQYFGEKAGNSNAN